MNLSELKSMGRADYWEEDVSNFVKKILERIDNIQHDCASLEICRKDEVEKIIKEEAGDKLT